MPEPIVNQKPTSVEVNVGGVKYIVTPELAKSLEKDNSDRQAAIEAAKRQQAPQIQRETTQQPANVVKIGDRLFENPDQVFGEFEGKIKQDIRNEYQKMRDEEKANEQATKSLAEFYSGFFNENKELAQDRDLVELIFERNYNSWNQEVNGDLNGLKKKLAERATTTILRSVKPNETPKQQQVFESGNSQIFGQPEVAPSEKSGSMTEILRARREARTKK